MIDINPSSVSKIRFSDCDMLGHLNNSRHLDYHLDAREDHLKKSQNFDFQYYFKQDLGWVVGNHEISYLKPAIYNEIVKLQSTLLVIENDFLIYESIMMDENESHLKSIVRTKLIPISLKTGKKVEHSSDFMEWAKKLENKNIDPTLNLQERITEIIIGLKARMMV